MARFHIGLVHECPVSSLVMAGQSFQRYSWKYRDQDGVHSEVDGLKVEIEDEEEAKSFESRVKNEGHRWAIRSHRGKDGKILRAEVVDAKAEGHQRLKLDEPVAKYAYCKRIPSEDPALPETLESLGTPELVGPKAKRS